MKSASLSVTLPVCVALLEAEVDPAATDSVGVEYSRSVDRLREIDRSAAADDAVEGLGHRLRHANGRSAGGTSAPPH